MRLPHAERFNLVARHDEKTGLKDRNISSKRSLASPATSQRLATGCSILTGVLLLFHIRLCVFLLLG